MFSFYLEGNGLPWLMFWQKSSLHMELLPDSLKLFGLPLWTTHFVSLDHGNLQCKSITILLGGADFTAQAPGMMQMVP